MATGFIYEWTNKINGKKYIGSHLGEQDDGYLGSGVAFKRAVKKYSIDFFERVILEIVEKEKLLEREQYYLDLYNAASNENFYNMKQQAGGGFDFINNNSTIKEKNIARLKNQWKEKQHPKGMLGKKHTSDSNKRRFEGWHKWADKMLKKPVYQFDLSGNKIARYDSLCDAASSIGVKSPSNIKYTCDGKFMNAHGYIWSYNDNITPTVKPENTKGKKKIKTPDGIFPTVTAVVKHYNLSSTKQVRDRCLSKIDKWSEWCYIF